jgi:DNA-binding LytR/AlgR family response regulator
MEISMKIKIEMDEQVAEEEVIIRCRGMTEQIAAIQKAVSEAAGAVQKMVLYKGNTEYYLPMNDILFFETADSGVVAHTGNDLYEARYKLYELEEILPGFFMRVSKSTILNTTHIFSINRNLSKYRKCQLCCNILNMALTE